MEKKANPFGSWAIILILLAYGLLFLAFSNLVRSYSQSASTAADIRFVITGTRVAFWIALLSLFLSIIGFLPRGLKKKAATAAFFLSALLLLVSGALVYSYDYMFSTLKQDESFHQEDLLVVSPREDGVIDLSPVPPGLPLPSGGDASQSVNMGQSVDLSVPDEVMAYMDRYEAKEDCILLPGSEKIRNYLLFGLDDVGSSDSILLVSVDPLHKKLKIFSLPRDSYAYIPKQDTYTRITYAYRYGGAAMAVAAVNYNLSLNITDYITLSLDEVQMVIDYVGGVTVNMGYTEWDYFTQCGFKGLNVGECHLNGWEAMNYMRLREPDSEIRRMERQREVLHALYTAALQLPVEKFPDLVRGGMQMCTTSLDTYTILSLALEAIQNNYKLEQHGLVDLVEFWNGRFGPENTYYLVFDWDYTADTLYRLIYEDYYISGYDYETKNTP